MSRGWRKSISTSHRPALRQPLCAQRYHGPSRDRERLGKRRQIDERHSSVEVAENFSSEAMQ